MSITFKQATQSVTEDEFKDFVGTNAYKFASAKEAAFKGKRSKIELLPFLFPALYAAYYKFWTPTIALILAFAIGSFIKMNTLTGLIFVSIVYIYYALNVKTDYIKYAYKKVAKIKVAESDAGRIKLASQEQGNRSSIAMLIAFLITIICNLTVIVWIDKINHHSLNSVVSEIQPAKNLKIGDTFTSGPFKVTVDKVGQSSRDTEITMPGKAQIFVFYSYSNVSQQPVSWSNTPYAVLVDAKGTVYHPEGNRDADALQTQLIAGGDLNPNSPQNLSAKFEIPEALYDANTWHIQFEDIPSVQFSIN